ncbi:MAG: hypothetical protein KBF30_01475 [Hyphomonadaceae bacterium]|nr:hypothetical protein [Hyphomonadaceae bacterium]
MTLKPGLAAIATDYESGHGTADGIREEVVQIVAGSYVCWLGDISDARFQASS